MAVLWEAVGWGLESMSHTVGGLLDPKEIRCSCGGRGANLGESANLKQKHIDKH